MNKTAALQRKKTGQSASTAPSTSSPVKHHLIGNRHVHGKALRQHTPRSSHAEWSPPSDRRDPIKILIESSERRVQHLVPIRYGRMLQSPFAFYRPQRSWPPTYLTRRLQAYGYKSAAIAT